MKRPVLRLGCAGVALLAASAFSPTVAAIAGGALIPTVVETLRNVLIGNAANAIDAAIFERENPTAVSLQNAHLTRVVGRAIQSVLEEVAQTQSGEVRKTLTHIAKAAPEQWCKLAQQERTQGSYPELLEGNLPDLLTPSETGLVVAAVLTVADWQDIVRRLDLGARPGGGYGLAPEVLQLVAEQLHTCFPKALREALKADFKQDGAAFAGLMITLLAELRQAVGQRPDLGEQVDRDVVAAELARLAAQLQGSQAEQRQAFEQLAQRLDFGFEQLIEIGNTLLDGQKALTAGQQAILAELQKLVRFRDFSLAQLQDLLKKLDGKGQHQTAGLIRGSDPHKAVSHWQERTTEQAKLLAWCNDQNVTLAGIVGIGGTGKSSLAGWLYGRKEINYPLRFWADLSTGGTFAELARRVLAAFGLPMPEQEPQLVSALVRGLQQVQALVVLDNLESVLTAEERGWQDGAFEQFMRLWLEQGASSLVLVTTRERPELRGFNQWLPLAGLETAAGVKLLQTLGIRGDLEPFVKLVAGHPLLLRLVADLLLAEYGQDPSLERLQNLGLGDLQGLLTSEAVVGQHRDLQKNVGMAVVLDATVARLTELQRRVFERVAVLRGAFDVGAAAALAEASVEEVAGALRELVRRSLLEEELLPSPNPLPRGEGFRFRFQPVVAEYARWRCGDLAAAHGLAAAYFAEKPKPEQPWQTLEDVRDFWELFHHRFELGDYDGAFDAVWECDDCLTLRGFYSTRIELYGQLVAAWQAQNAKENWRYGASLTDLGNAYHALGQYQQAIAFHQQSLEVMRFQKHRQGEAASLGNLGNAYYSLGQYQEAIAFHQQHLEFAREIGDRGGEAASLCNLGHSHKLLGEYQQAISLYQKAIKIAHDIGHRRWEANSLNGLGNASQSLGQYQKAIAFHQQSLEIKQEIGDRRGEAASLGNLGLAYRALGQYQEAIAFHQQSLEIKQEIGDRRGEAASLGNLGLAYRALGQYEKAIAFHQQHLDIAREIGDRLGEAASLGNLGLAYRALGQYEKAIAFHQQHLDIAREIGDRLGEAASLGNLGLAYDSLGQYEKAIAYHQQHLDIAREIGNRRGEAASLGNLGIAYQSLGQYEKAIAFHQQHLDIAREIGNRRGEAASLGNLGLAYDSLGQYEKAIAFHQQSLEIKREIGDRRGEAASLCNLGIAYAALKQPLKAIQYQEQSLQIMREIGDRRGEMQSLQALAQLYMQVGRIKEGYQATAQMQEIARELNLPLKVWPLPQWQKTIAQFAQRSTTHLACCFLLGLLAFPFALIWIILITLYRLARAPFRKR